MKLSVLKCDRCGKIYERGNSYNHVEDGKEYQVNSIRIGNWDQKNKKWVSIASGYDLCPDCARTICDVIFAGENNNLKMRSVMYKTNDEGKEKENESENA